MPESSDELKKNHANSGCQVREDNEYVRLVIPSEPRKSAPDILDSQSQDGKGSHLWWAKTILWCSITVIILLIFVKWGLPFLVKKVLFPILQWESTAFGRPVLALVLVGSLALFPVFFIPSGPSMWLAGMIFGYGLGFIIIMVGTTIGMTLPFLVGLLFRDRIHQWLKRWPQKAAMIRLAGEGSCGRLIRTLADIKYGNHHLTPVEIIYNAISFIIAIITIVVFTVYAKRKLKDLETEEADDEGSAVDTSSFELHKLPNKEPIPSFALSLPVNG
ncbi:hypothetical protein C2S52_004580 [Perilla frutescens var. hirtella]|nr:hypothetical protein C2S51_011019 [Perilla frutescens var. frutescens]KAH6794103.1 hypothetical protein C2S52_004580 [Perilla frutescens var. hirtella]